MKPIKMKENDLLFVTKFGNSEDVCRIKNAINRLS